MQPLPRKSNCFRASRTVSNLKGTVNVELQAFSVKVMPTGKGTYYVQEIHYFHCVVGFIVAQCAHIVYQFLRVQLVYELQRVYS